MAKRLKDAQEACKIVKGGESFMIGPLSYRTGYDVRKQGKKYFVSVMNGPFEIFKGEAHDSLEEAEIKGLEAMLRDKPALARNVSVDEGLVNHLIIEENERRHREMRLMGLDEAPPGFYLKEAKNA